jgi:hypothetical protein
MGKLVAKPKKCVLSARFTREEKLALEAYAKKRGAPLSEIIRERLLGTNVGG